MKAASIYNGDPSEGGDAFADGTEVVEVGRGAVLLAECLHCLDGIRRGSQHLHHLLHRGSFAGRCQLEKVPLSPASRQITAELSNQLHFQIIFYRSIENILSSPRDTWRYINDKCFCFSLESCVDHVSLSGHIAADLFGSVQIESKRTRQDVIERHDWFWYHFCFFCVPQITNVQLIRYINQQRQRAELRRQHTSWRHQSMKYQDQHKKPTQQTVVSIRWSQSNMRLLLFRIHKWTDIALLSDEVTGHKQINHLSVNSIIWLSERSASWSQSSTFRESVARVNSVIQANQLSTVPRLFIKEVVWNPLGCTHTHTHRHRHTTTID